MKIIFFNSYYTFYESIFIFTFPKKLYLLLVMVNMFIFDKTLEENFYEIYCSNP